jgi:invasion protein IalB
MLRKSGTNATGICHRSRVRQSSRSRYRFTCAHLSSLIIALCMTSAMAQSTPQPKRSDRVPDTLPNGASSISETYGDWTVKCAIVDGKKACVFSQTRSDEKGDRVFAVEFHSAQNGATNGILLMPFGLKLADGVKLKIDAQNLGQGAPFESCLQQGCIVPLTLPTVATDAMKNGKNLIVSATFANAAEPTAFSISLAGFAAALSRVGDLTK